MTEQNPIYYIEKIDIEADPEDGEHFEEVKYDEEISDSEAEEDLETALRSMQQTLQTEGVEQDKTIPKATVSRRPEVVDDSSGTFLFGTR